MHHSVQRLLLEAIGIWANSSEEWIKGKLLYTFGLGKGRRESFITFPPWELLLMKRDDFVEVMGEGYQEHDIHNKRLPCETLVGETKKLYFKEAPVPASLSE